MAVSLAVSLSAQVEGNLSSDYDKQWTEVKSLVQKGKPTSAIEIVNDIYKLALKDQNEPQMLKALEYEIRLRSGFEENYYQKGIETVNKELSTFTAPSANVLHALLADLYLGYYSMNRHKILDRTNLNNYELQDIASWDQKHFAEAIFFEFSRSLSDKEILQSTSASQYSDILKEGDSLNEFRPTLYDILAHNALDFYKNDEFMASRPAIRFEIDDPQMLDIAEVFVKLELVENEAFSLKFHALKLYQEMIAFHLKDEDPAVLVDLDLNRLDFVSKNNRIEDVEKLLLHTLEQMESLYIGYPAVTEVYYQLALRYKISGQRYRPLESDEHKRDLIVAVQYCKNALAEFPDSYGASQCKRLLSIINSKALGSIIPYANIPGEHILTSLSLKNLSTIYLRVIPLDPDKVREQKRNLESKHRLAKYRQIRPDKHWGIEIPGETDHHLHFSEIAIPPLPEGYYGLLISDNAAFEQKDGVVTFRDFWVTNISYISNENDHKDQLFYMLDRKTGEKLSDVDVDIYQESYNQQSRSYQALKIGSYKSDEDGKITIPVTRESSQRIMLDFSKELDRLTSQRQYHWSEYSDYVSTAKATHFFTDRSIYRPGQTIYFKAILLERIGEKYEIRKNEPTTVQFYDVNNQKVSEIQLVSNEYGSVNGVFTAPSGMLTGNMHIQNGSGNVRFSVEEYKRPKFEVTFEPVKGSYKLDSKVSVHGKATAFSGNPLDNAMVKYRVVRDEFYPYPYYRGRSAHYSVSAEISNGEIQTDETGAFNIDFTAISDRSPWHMFTYTVHVDVTDINGETHSGQKSVAVGNKSLLIKLDMSDKVNADDDNNFKLETTNLNGTSEPSLVDIKIEQLKTPEKVLIERNWNSRPDIYLLSEEEFRKLFPNTVYKDENDKSKWAISKTLFENRLDTKNDSILTLNGLKSWGPGEYKIEMKATDVFGEDIVVTKYITLFSSSSKKLPAKMANWFVPLNTTLEPGEKARFLIGTSLKNVRLLYEIRGKDGTKKHEWIALSNEQKLLEITVSEEDRGGFGFSLIFVQGNRSYLNAHNITVPYTNKKLDVRFETFRDKLLPGEKESWNIKIRSHKGEKVAAEMLAGMYDASLDAIRPHHWDFNLYTFKYSHNNWDANSAFANSRENTYFRTNPYLNPMIRSYNQLAWKGFYFRGTFYREYYMDGLMMRDGEAGNIRGARAEKTLLLDDEEAEMNIQDPLAITPPPPSGEAEKAVLTPIQIRKNLQETAFFFPDLMTNEDGDLVISFTMPEALTRWKMMGLAYTGDLSIGNITKELVTQKDLMIIPNQPRFFREGDEIWFSARVVNMSDKELKGEATLQLFDVNSMKPLDDSFGNDESIVRFTASKGNSANVSWKLKIPENSGPVLYRVMAESGNFTDGEEMMIPVLKNRMLVTESMPLPINGNESKEFVFEKFANSQSKNSSLSNYSYTLEFTSNPAWYAVQALPYLMEYPRECSEQIFNRVYANAFASHIVNKHPNIKTVFESWKTETPDALLSKLEQNQDLKNALLEETPWVMQAKNESERKKRIALLFDLNRMDNELITAFNKLRKNQLSNGGWPWFAGGPDSKFITQYILTGFGKMRHLGVIDKANNEVNIMVREAIRYADERMFEDFMSIKDKHDDYQSAKYISRNHIQYLYARSFFLEDFSLLEKHKEGFMYFKEQAKKYWLDYDRYLQGMIALSLHRLGDKPLPSMIMASIKEHALYSEEMGMYWRQDAGYYWYEAPIETQALLVEAFDEILYDKTSVELMKTWLLKQKQTQDWETTKATADACYALLLRGPNLIAEEGDVNISVGGKEFDPSTEDGVEQQAGTGYFRHRWSGNDITTEMANIKITKANDGVAWGAVYWQYFEDLDKITEHASPLNITKKLFVELNTEEGPVLKAVNEGDILKTGDKLVSRIEIRVDRDMEFVHMKDMRAAAFEPRNSLSAYRWQGGMGYYESIRDASVNFFFSYLRKGTWVFEYPMNVTQKGSFSNGISTIQCMYAPEFASHSEGVRINVE